MPAFTACGDVTYFNGLGESLTLRPAATPGAIAISHDNLLLVTTTLNGNPALVAYSVK